MEITLKTLLFNFQVAEHRPVPNAFSGYMGGYLLRRALYIGSRFAGSYCVMQANSRQYCIVAVISVVVTVNIIVIINIPLVTINIMILIIISVIVYIIIIIFIV